MVTPAKVDTGVAPKTLRSRIAACAKQAASSYDDVCKKKGTKKWVRDVLAELLAYVEEQEIRDRLPYTQPPS